MKNTNETKIGIITICAFACLIFGYSFLKGNSIFSGANTYYAIYDHIDGLSETNAVMTNGFQIGRVTQLELVEENKIRVAFSINKKYVIPKNTVAKVMNSDLLGAKYVSFIMGDSHEIAENKSYLTGAFDESILDVINPLKDKTSQILLRIDSIFSSVNNILNSDFQKNIGKSLNSISHTLNSIEDITGTLDRETEHVRNILLNVNAFTDQLSKSSKNIGSVISNLDNISDQLAKAQLTATVENANKTLIKFNRLIEDIHNGSGSMSAFIKDKELYDNLVKSSNNLDRLLIDLKAHPKRYVHFSLFGGKDQVKKKEKKDR